MSDEKRECCFSEGRSKGTLVSLRSSHGVSSGAPLPEGSKYTEVHCLITELAAVGSPFGASLEYFSRYLTTHLAAV